MLTINQVSELLNIIEKNQLTLLGKELGPDFLTKQDKSLLESEGVNVKGLYSLENDTIATSFHFGLLSEAIGYAKANELTYEQLKQYISHGDYIPLTQRELTTINSIRSQKFNDLKTLRGTIFKDVNQFLINSSLEGQQQFLREQIEQGYLDKKTVRQISNDIAEKTGDWSRDFDRIIAYTTTLAEQEGKAAMIQRNVGENEDPIVYKVPYADACKHCIRLYLTNGIGSQPRLFKLSKLRENGTNIGRKTEEWRAVIGGIHPWCRCYLQHLPKGYVWNEKTKLFEASSAGEVKKVNRPLIRIWVAGKEAWV